MNKDKTRQDVYFPLRVWLNISTEKITFGKAVVIATAWRAHSESLNMYLSSFFLSSFFLASALRRLYRS